MDICDYLKQGGQTAGHRDLLRTLFKDELNAPIRGASRAVASTPHGTRTAASSLDGIFESLAWGASQRP
jgi:hypothetical protein